MLACLHLLASQNIKGDCRASSSTIAVLLCQQCDLCKAGMFYPNLMQHPGTPAAAAHHWGMWHLLAAAGHHQLELSDWSEASEISLQAPQAGFRGLGG